MTQPLKKAIFIDRDGTIILEPADVILYGSFPISHPPGPLSLTAAPFYGQRLIGNLYS